MRYASNYFTQDQSPIRDTGYKLARQELPFYDGRSQESYNHKMAVGHKPIDNCTGEATNI